MKLRVEPRLPGDIPIGALLLAVICFAPIGGYLIDHGRFQFSECGVKAAFGIPCLSCGATRATLHFLHGNWIDAFLMQPLVFVIYIAILIWGVFSLRAVVHRRTYFPEFSLKEGIAVTIAMLAVVIGNWFYLLEAGI